MIEQKPISFLSLVSIDCHTYETNGSDAKHFASKHEIAQGHCNFGDLHTNGNFYDVGPWWKRERKRKEKKHYVNHWIVVWYFQFIKVIFIQSLHKRIAYRRQFASVWERLSEDTFTICYRQLEISHFNESMTELGLNTSSLNGNLVKTLSRFKMVLTPKICMHDAKQLPSQVSLNERWMVSYSLMIVKDVCATNWAIDLDRVALLWMLNGVNDILWKHLSIACKSDQL